ncbi:MAG TPA: class I SAM-dependent methyltransferase [Solirubrobacterales bacterium]|nr:class I SAM-dependent methyltransferase [Solirubrobacterales bacterium]
MSAERQARDAMRRGMFLSQDGVVLSTTLRALDDVGILLPSLEAERSLAELCPELTEPGFGALRVALHGLAATGWLREPPALEPERATLGWTEAGRVAMERREEYVELGEFLATFPDTADDAWTRPWTQEQTERFHDLVAQRETGPSAGVEGELVASHLDGGLLVPAMLWLHETGRLGEAGPDLPGGELGAAMADLLAGVGWVGDGAWTESGRQARAFGLNFGGVATYLPLLARLPKLYRGDLTVVPDPAAQEPEWHVHRALNVRISAAAHRRYFADSEPLFAEIFNREPVSEQPRFIADMGCGEGSWLVHLQQLVEARTRRGQQLAEHPLTMVGIDPDSGALAAARRNLEAAGATPLLLHGDVTDPDRLAADLSAHGLAIEDGLHIRSFIDHERRFLGADPGAQGPGWSSGVYVDYAGAAVSGEAVESDLVAHLRRWARHVPRHGMVVLEAHCVAPQIVARNLGSLHGIAFDAHQAYSKQYPVDHPAFLECCREAGLQPVGHRETRYPSRRPFVAVSLNRLLAAGEGSPLPSTGTGAARADTWQPAPDVDLEDGRALHEIIFRRGDIRYPATWCSAPTGFVVSRTLAALEARLDQAGGGETVRVLDYGAGTGTATIELLKACRERGIDRRCERQGVSIEVHLVDLPSSWYALGHELLRDCAWTRFHSLRAEDGGFRPLAEVLGGAGFDAAMANMVFHLIPPRALGRTMEQLASVLGPGASLAWSAPDLGPAAPGTVLLHDPNRALRERLLELQGDRLGEAERRAAQARADRRIRPRPLADDVTAALARQFDGETSVAAYEMLAEDIVRGLLVPSNQAEFLPEIADRAQREETIRRLMLDEVLPQMQAGAAGTGLGLNFHWTLGSYSRRP